MGRGKKGAPGSLGYWPSQVLLLQVWQSTQACEEIFGLVPGKFWLQGVEAVPRGSSEPMLVLQVHLVFAQQFSALTWKHNILLCYLWSFTAACLHAYQTVHQKLLALTLLLGTSVSFFPHLTTVRTRASPCHFFSSLQNFFIKNIQNSLKNSM